MTSRVPWSRMPALFCCTSLMCLAQSGGRGTQTTPEITSHDSPFTLSTAVNLVMIPAVVRDARGHAIGTLRQEDFRLFDKGKLQTITKFSVEKTSAEFVPPATSSPTAAGGNAPPKPGDTSAARSVARHFLAWLFDDVHLSFSDLAQARAAAIRVIKEPSEPGTRLAVYTTSGHISVDFTDDRDRLAQAVNQIRPFPNVIGSPEDCPAISYYQADRILNLNDQEAQFAAEISYVMKCSPPGSTRRDVEAALQEAHQVVRALVPRALVLGGRATEVNLGILRDLIRRMAVLPGTRSILLVSPGFFLRDDSHDTAADVMDRALRANVVISSLGTQGVSAITPGGNADTPPGLPIEVKQEFDRKAGYADEGIMQDLADGTGGTLFHNSNDFAGSFRRSAAQPEYIYVLGFSPQNIRLDGSFHALKVSLRNGAGLQLQARRGYFEGHAAGQQQEEVKEAFFSRDEIRGLPVELLTEIHNTENHNVDLSILARIDLKGLHYRKNEGRNNDALTLMAGVFDHNGNYVTGNLRTIDLKLKDQTLEEYPQERITVRTNLEVASGSYTVRLVVRDSEGQIMSAQNSPVVIP